MKKLLLIIPLLSSGCVFRHNVPAPTDYHNLSKLLVTGMSKQDVIKVLGNPASKDIRGKREIYYFYSIDEETKTTEVLNYTLLLPLNMFGGTPVINVRREISTLTVYFDENGKLEKF